MISSFIIDTIRKLAKEFPFQKLDTTLTPFIRVSYLTAEKAFTEVTVSLFFCTPNKNIYSGDKGQTLSVVANSHCSASVKMIPFVSGARSSFADNTGKTTTYKMSEGETLIITVLTPIHQDQDLVTDYVLKALTAR